jgi:type I restriction enzyme, S subunit
MSIEGWTSRTLSDVIDIKHGYAFEGKYFAEEPPGDILLTPGNFAIGGGFKGEKFKYYRGPVPEEFALAAGDLLLTMTDLSKQADTLGYPAFVPQMNGCRLLHNQRLGKVIERRDAEIDRRFLYYLFCTREYRHEVLASATGTTVKHTSPRRILSHRFQCPPLREQQAIASTLGALDDKIELNRRMNETLEALAQSLFKCWFIDATQNGLPQGWREGALGEVAENPRRGIQPNEIKLGTPYIALEHMPRRCIALSEWGAADSLESNKFEFKRGEILFGKLRPYFHKVGVSPVDGVCSTDILLRRQCDFITSRRAHSFFSLSVNSPATASKLPSGKWSDARRASALAPEKIRKKQRIRMNHIVEFEAAAVVLHSNAQGKNPIRSR